MRGEGRALLPSEKVRAMVSREIDALVRFQEHFVWTIVIGAARSRDPRALVVRYLFPDDIHRTAQVFAVARMQAFDSGARLILDVNGVQ